MPESAESRIMPEILRYGVFPGNPVQAPVKVHHVNSVAIPKTCKHLTG